MGDLKPAPPSNLNQLNQSLNLKMIKMNFRTLAVASAASILALTITACGGGDNAEESTDNASAQHTEQQTQGNMPEVKTQATSKSGNGTHIGYTPAQIRARYGLTNMTTPAQRGSGQTIVIISAYNNSTAGNDLNVFAKAHGLPGCKIVESVITREASGNYNTTTPAKTPGAGCTFQKISVDANGNVAGQVHRRTRAVTAKHTVDDQTWTIESNMDIQWAHAIAPMANIVLVQMPSPFPLAVSTAVRYANQFADVVSMSFGAVEAGFRTPSCPGYIDRKARKFVLVDMTCTPERALRDVFYGPANPVMSNGKINYTAGGLDTVAFSNPAVTYVAASGDWGVKPVWPAVSNRVLAVGGTNIQRAVEAAWANSGGGLSKVYSTPAHQAALGYATRAVPDVSIVGDSRSAVSMYVSPQRVMPDSTCVAKMGAANCGWYGGYGTSVGAPMWAGLAAITRAMRAEKFLAAVNFTNSIYAMSSTAQYYQAFTDVTTGSRATVGFDLVTGLGSPKADALTKFLSSY